MTGDMTREQAKALAYFIHDAVRPDWGEAGILAALAAARAKGTAAAVALAAIACAQDATNRTPAVIPLAGPHWAVGGAGVARPQAPPRNRTCATCYLGEDQCRKRWQWDHDFESLEDAKARRISEADVIPEYVRRRYHGKEPTYLNGRAVKVVELP